MVMSRIWFFTDISDNVSDDTACLSQWLNPGTVHAQIIVCDDFLSPKALMLQLEQPPPVWVSRTHNYLDSGLGSNRM